MIEEEFEQAVAKLNDNLNLAKVDDILKPVLLAGMKRGYVDAHLEVFAEVENINPEEQTAEWVDRAEKFALDNFGTLDKVARKNSSDLYAQIKSMLSEEYHEITHHNHDKIGQANVVMPYFNGWFLGAYYAFIALFTQMQQAQGEVGPTETQAIAKAASDRAEKEVEVERRKFNNRPIYRQSMLREMVAALYAKRKRMTQADAWCHAFFLWSRGELNPCPTISLLTRLRS